MTWSSLRRGERGAAVFIVVMVITLLTAIGIFAARSISLTDVAAGFERESAQTAYLAQFAGNLVTTDIGTMPDSYGAWLSAKPTDTCYANRSATLGVHCVRKLPGELDARTQALGGEPLFNPSLLNASGTLNADFAVELTDYGSPINGLPPGASGVFASALMTPIVKIKSATTVCGPDQASVPQQLAQSIVTFGPVMQPP